MAVNASVLGLTHYEDMPVEILQMIAAGVRKPTDDGTAWPVLSKVCKNWRRAAGTSSWGATYRFVQGRL